MAEIKPQRVLIDIVQKTEHNGFVFIGTAMETGDLVQISIQTKKYDEDKNQRVDDVDTYNEAMERLTALGVTSIVTAEDELNEKALAGELILEDVYVNGDVSSFKPLQSGFEVFEKKITNPQSKAFDGQEVETGSFSEFKNFRFNIGADVVDRDGETKHIRISQITLDNDNEDTIGLNYISKNAQKIYNDIKDNKIPENRVEKVKSLMEAMIAKDRDAKIKELTKLFGSDFEKYIGNSEIYLKGKIKMKAVGEGKDRNNYAALLVDPEDFVVHVEKSDEE